MTLRTCVACAVLLAASFVGRPAAAQLSGDSAAVARAAASFLGENLLPGLARQRPLWLGQPTTPFDWEVTLLLRDAHGLALIPAEERPFGWVVTRGITLAGDTAAVIVETGASLVPTPDRLIDTWIEKQRYVFVRTPGGWIYQRIEFISVADIGRVRG